MKPNALKLGLQTMPAYGSVLFVNINTIATRPLIQAIMHEQRSNFHIKRTRIAMITIHDINIKMIKQPVFISESFIITVRKQPLSRIRTMFQKILCHTVIAFNN